MNKITKKSVNTLMEIYKSNKTDVVLKLTNPADQDSIIMEISVKLELSITEKGIFVDRVVNSCFDVDGDFLPQYVDPVFAITLLQMTTNVPVFEKEITPTLLSGNEAPTTVKVVDIEKTYQLCKAINLVHNVVDDRYKALVADLKGLVTAKLEYMKRVNAGKTSNMLHVIQPALESLQEVISNNVVQPVLKSLQEVISNNAGKEALNDALRKSEQEIDNLIQLSPNDKE